MWTRSRPVPGGGGSSCDGGVGGGQVEVGVTAGGGASGVVAGADKCSESLGSETKQD